MRVSEIMNPVTAVVGGTHTLRQVAARMVQHNTGAAIVIDNAHPGPAVINERHILRAIARGLDPDVERAEDHLRDELITASPELPVEEAAALMVKHSVRHVLVFDGPDLVGVLSMRDVVRVLRLEVVRDVVGVDAD